MRNSISCRKAKTLSRIKSGAPPAWAHAHSATNACCCREGFYTKSSPSLMQYAIREIFINRLHPLRAHRPQTQCFNCSDQKYLEALGIFLEDRRAQRRTQQWCYVVFSPWVCLLKGIFYRRIVLANICKSSSPPRLSHRPHATGQAVSPVCFSRYYCLR